MVMTTTRRAFWLGCLLLLVGCEDEEEPLPTAWFATQEIYAHMKAVQNERGSVLTTVQLRNGAGSNAAYLYLSSGENLYTSLNQPPEQLLSFSDDLFTNAQATSSDLQLMQSRYLSAEYVLFSEVVWGSPEYYVTDTPETSYPTRAYVVLERKEHEMTSSSVVDLPSPFHILEPAQWSSISRTNPLQLTWSDVDPKSTMQLDVAGLCDSDARYTMSLILGTDVGAKTLTSADYFSSTISPQSNCHLAFLLKRIRSDGTVSTEFAFGSTFQGIQQRTVQFTSTP